MTRINDNIWFDSKTSGNVEIEIHNNEIYIISV
jgi:hypothetical protein